MSIIRYKPWNLLDQLQQELELSRGDKSGEGAVATAEWAPAVDIKVEVDKFIIHADIPGVKPEDIEVRVNKEIATGLTEKIANKLLKKYPNKLPSINIIQPPLIVA